MNGGGRWKVRGDKKKKKRTKEKWSKEEEREGRGRMRTGIENWDERETEGRGRGRQTMIYHTRLLVKRSVPLTPCPCVSSLSVLLIGCTPLRVSFRLSVNHTCSPATCVSSVCLTSPLMHYAVMNDTSVMKGHTPKHFRAKVNLFEKAFVGVLSIYMERFMTQEVVSQFFCIMNLKTSIRTRIIFLVFVNSWCGRRKRLRLPTQSPLILRAIDQQKIFSARFPIPGTKFPVSVNECYERSVALGVTW